MSENIAEWLGKLDLTVELVRAKRQTPPTWAKDGKHGVKYDVVFKKEGKQESKLLFWGSINDKEKGTPPDIAGVIECLVSEAHAGELSFEDFCGDLGYNPASISAKAPWRACQRIKTQLEKWLGDNYQTLLEWEF